MIHVIRLNHVPIVVDSDLIEHIESTPDTVLTLTTGHKIVVLEDAEEVVERVIRFRRLIQRPAREEQEEEAGRAEQVR